MRTKERRKLAAIMFTDIVGYSSMMLENENYGRHVRKQHRFIFEQYSKTHQGNIIQYYGDGTLSMFDSAVTAVQCAVAMQREFVSAGIPIRIGIHLGDIIYDETEIFGHGVNVAARIEPLCHPGGILISGKVRDEIINHEIGIPLSMGIFAFEKLQQEIELYAISTPGLISPSDRDSERMRELTLQLDKKDRQMAISGNELKTKPRESKLIQLRPLVVGAVLVFLGFFIGLGLENPMVPTSTQSYSRVIEHPTRQSESNSEMQATNPLLWSASYHLWKSGISETDLSFYRHLKEGTVNPSSGLTAPSCTTISRVNLIRLEENEQNPDQTEFPLRKVSPKILHQPDLKKVIACNLQYPKEVFTQLSNRR